MVFFSTLVHRQMPGHKPCSWGWQGRKSLDCNGTQGSIRGRAPSSYLDALIFQPFGRYSQLFFYPKQRLIRLAWGILQVPQEYACVG